jgi:hypothetical protein
MSLQSRFDSSRLPIPEYNVACSVATAYPLAVGGKPDLTSIACYRMARKPLFAILPEVVCAVNQNLIIKRLGGKVFFWQDMAKTRISVCGEKRLTRPAHVLDG